MRMKMALPAEDLKTRDQLVMQHVDLVKSMASRLGRRLPAQVEVSELVSVGVLGLIDAASRYRPSLGVPFDAFARRRIHGAMLDALRGLDWVPRSVRKLQRDVDSALTNLRHLLGREPDSKEIAQAPTAFARHSSSHARLSGVPPRRTNTSDQTDPSRALLRRGFCLLLRLTQPRRVL